MTEQSRINNGIKTLQSKFLPNILTLYLEHLICSAGRSSFQLLFLASIIMWLVPIVQQNKSQTTPRIWAENWFNKTSGTAVWREKGLIRFPLTPPRLPKHTKPRCLQTCFAPSLPLHMTQLHFHMCNTNLSICGSSIAHVNSLRTQNVAETFWCDAPAHNDSQWHLRQPILITAAVT